MNSFALLIGSQESAHGLDQAQIAQAIRQQAVKDRDEAMSVLLSRHGADVSTWPVHIRLHFERLQAAQQGGRCSGEGAL